MNTKSLLFVDPPKLSDENVHEILNFLYEITQAFEDYYRNQWLRYNLKDKQLSIPLNETWHDLDDGPPF